MARNTGTHGRGVRKGGYRRTAHKKIRHSTRSFKNQKDDFIYAVRSAGFGTKLIVGTVIVAAIMIGTLSIANSLNSISKKEEILAQLDQQILDQTAENKKLEDELKGDLDQLIEAKAREKLDMVYPGEKIFYNTAG